MDLRPSATWVATSTGKAKPAAMCRSATNVRNRLGRREHRNADVVELCLRAPFKSVPAKPAVCVF
jgi:hypothetical protein